MKLFLFSILTIICSCNSIKESRKNNNSNNTQLIENDSIFDCRTELQINTYGNTIDSLIKKVCIERKAVIFVKGKNYVYHATVLNSAKNTLSVTEVMVKGTNTRFSDDPTNQMNVEMVFERSILDSVKLHHYSDNKTCCQWYDSKLDGIVENIERIWMHPIRYNQFTLTETAGFPEVMLPLNLGKKWSSTLNFYGWGDWKNKTITSNYKVLSKKKYILDNEVVLCWEIESISDFEGKENKHIYLFNEQFGFVEMNYAFSNGIQIKFEMKECKFK